MNGEPATLNYARIVYELLTSANGWRVGSLQDELGIADRTYRHYRQTLQERFAPLRDEDGRSMIVEVKRGDERYLCLKDRSQLADASYGQVVALHFATQLFEFVKGTSLWPAIESSLKELQSRRDIQQMFGHALRNADRLFYYQPFAPKDYKNHGDRIQKAVRALILRRRIKVKYTANPDTPAKEHILEPLSLVLYLGGLYLLARFRDVRKVYQFLIDRIGDIEVLQEGFTYPAASEFTPAAFYEDSFGGFIEKGRRMLDVEIIFACKPWLKQYIRERTWHGSQRFEDLPGGRLRMTLRASGRMALARWVRMFGDDVELVKPKDLLEEEKAAGSMNAEPPVA